MQKQTYKTILSILTASLLLLSILVPILPVLGITDLGLSATSGNVGDTIACTGATASPGSLVKVYWDKVVVENLLNESYADGAGNFDINVDIPEDLGGLHYIIVSDGVTDVDSVGFTLDAKIELTPEAGLPDDTIDVEGTGFGEEVDITSMTFEKVAPGITNEPVGIGDGTTTQFSLDYYPVVAGSETIYLDSAAQPDDGSVYSLVDSTGVITFVTAPGTDVVITADYTMDVIDITPSPVPEISDLGSFTASFDVPDLPYGDDAYLIYAEDETTLNDDEFFTIGAIITLDPEEGPSGTVVDITGRGFTEQPGGRTGCYNNYGWKNGRALQRRRYIDEV